MTEPNEGASRPVWNKWRIGRWTGALILLLTPAVMMQFDDGWHWTIGSFLLVGTLLGGLMLLYELAERASQSRAFRAGIALVLVTSLLIVWTTIVRDDGNGIGYFLIVMAAGVGAFAAWLQPAGMARTTFGVAAMQVLLGLAIATAPVTTRVAGAAFQALSFNMVFAVLWLVAALCFHAAAKAKAH